MANNNKNGKKPKSTKNSKSRPSREAVAQVEQRNSYYRDGANKLFVAAVASTIGVVLSSIATIYSITHKENNVYFAAYPDGSLVELVPLNKPNHKESIVGSWLNEALVDTFDFHFYNINKRFSESSNKWFTRDGANLLMRALQDSGNFDSIIENQLIVSLSLDHAPMLVESKIVKRTREVFSWTFQVPGTLTYRSQSKTYSTKYIFTVTVDRRSMLEDPTGLGISQLLMNAAK